MGYQRVLTRRRFVHESAIIGSAALLYVAPFSGCGGPGPSNTQPEETKKTTEDRLPPRETHEQNENPKHDTDADRRVRPSDDPRIKAAHDKAGALVGRLRKIGPKDRLDAERERHLFKMIRISEHTWAGILKDLDAANAEIERSEEYCRKHGV